jgi:hypothetical protein
MTRRLLPAVVLVAAVVTATTAAAADAIPPAAATSATTARVTTTSSPSPVPPTPSSTATPTGGIQLGPGIPTTTAPTDPSSPVTVPNGGGCGFFDVTCHVESAINGWFRDLVTSALNPVLALLGHTLLATPDVTGGRIGALWGMTAGIANALVVLFVMAGGALVMTRETLHTRYAVKDLAPRIVVAVIAANASLALVGAAIPTVNALSRALLGRGVDAGDATAAMRQLVMTPLASGGIFLVLLGLVAAILAIVLLVTYIMRVALLTLLVAAAPLALICHALPQTEGTARLWWRAVAGLFVVQLAQSLVLISALRVFFSPDGNAAVGLSASGGLVDLLVTICLLWVMVRIPTWVSRIVFAGSGHRPSTLASVVKIGAAYKLLAAAL